jgi:hypothetical protein
MAWVLLLNKGLPDAQAPELVRLKQTVSLGFYLAEPFCTIVEADPRCTVCVALSLVAEAGRVWWHPGTCKSSDALARCRIQETHLVLKLHDAHICNPAACLQVPLHYPWLVAQLQ